jgi:hypothetical protein
MNLVNNLKQKLLILVFWEKTTKNLKTTNLVYFKNIKEPTVGG